jgi:serine/threonine protein kinase/tetratricopeptide (TPR) repeat protein
VDEGSSPRSPADDPSRSDSDSSSDRLVGREIDGRFEIRDVLGRGGMGVVYRVYDKERGIEVALKTLRGIAPDAVLRFKTEFRMLRDVKHPNLVQLGELFESSGTWFFTMDQLGGDNFVDWVRSTAPANVTTSTVGDSSSREPQQIAARSTTRANASSTNTDATAKLHPVDEAVSARAPMHVEHRAPAPRCEIARLRTALVGLARGLAALHAAGIVHRDVKPSNILVEPDGRAVLLDFGAVAELYVASNDDSVIGTVMYMAPEQARGDAIGPAADWYAVGVLVFQALTGRSPFGDIAGRELLVLKQHFAAPSPSTLVAGVPADLEWLCTNLLHADPEQRPREALILEMLTATSGEAVVQRPPFVGRESELAEIEKALADSRERTVCVLVEGESGVGKSVLVHHALEAAIAAHPRLVVLRGRCHERERVPFNAVDGVIDDLARYLIARGASSVQRVAPESATELLAVFGALGAVPTLAERAMPDAPTLGVDARERAFLALRELLGRIGKRRPVAVAIDDVQWADPDSIALLEALARGDAPICLIATKRVHEGTQISERIASAANDVRTIELGGLSANAAAELVRLVAADSDVETAQIVVESRGHPLFLRELVRHRGARTARLEDVIWERTRSLDASARALLAAIAVAGSPVPRHVATTTAAITDADRHIAALVDEHLVRVHGPRPQDAIEPYHDRIRTAVVAHVSTVEQRRIQGVLAHALEKLGASAAALLERFEAAGDHSRAAHYVVAAAKAALDAFAFGRAAELYQRALSTTHDPQRRAALLVPLADALANDGRTAEAAECYLEAAELETADETRQLDLLRRAAERFLMAGRLDRGLATARSVLARVDMTLPTTRVRTALGIVWNQLRMRRALDWKPRTVVDPRALHADICWSIGAGLGMVDTLLGAYFSGRAARIALEAGTPAQIARALSSATIGAAVLGRRERAVRLLAAARRAAADDGTPTSSWYAELAQTAHHFVLENDFARTLESATRLEQAWYRAGHGPGWETDIALHFALSSLQMLGRYGEMAHRATAQIALAKRKGDLFQDVTFRVRFAMRHVIADRADVGRADVLDALASWLPGTDTFGNQRAWGLWSRIRIALYTNAFATLESELGIECQRMQRSLVGRIPILRVEWLHAYGTYMLGLAIAARKRSATDAAGHLRAASALADKLAKLDFPGALAGAKTLRAGIAMLGDDRDARVTALRDAIGESKARNIHVAMYSFERRLGEELGGDEGALLIASGDERARTAGMIAPQRATEVFLPSGRFV